MPCNPPFPYPPDPAELRRPYPRLRVGEERPPELSALGTDVRLNCVSLQKHQLQPSHHDSSGCRPELPSHMNTLCTP